MYRGHACLLHNCIGTERIERRDIHLEAAAYTGHIATHLTERLNAKSLIFKLSAGSAVIHVAAHHYCKTEYEFSYSIGVLTWGILRAHTVSGSGGEVDIIISGSGTHYNLKITGCVKHIGIHLIRTDYKRVNISDSLKEIVFGRIFLKQDEFGTSLLDDFAHTVNSHCCKRFFSCYEDFHDYQRVINAVSRNRS